MLRQGGYLGYIVSQGWLRLGSFHELRKLILAEYTVNEIVEFPYNVFRDAAVKTCMFAMHRSHAGSQHQIQILTASQSAQGVSFEPLRRIPQAAFQSTYKNVFDTSISPATETIKQKMKLGPTIGSMFDVRFGMKTADDKKFIHSEKGKHPEDKPLIRGDDVKRYQINYAGEYVWYVPDRMRRHRKTARPGEPERFEQPKVLVKDTSTDFACAYDAHGYYVKDVLIVTQKKKGTKDVPDLRVIAGLINSRVLKFYYRTTFRTLHVQNKELESLPLPPISSDSAERQKQCERMVNFVERLIETYRTRALAKTDREQQFNDNQIASLESHIDELAYAMYGLTLAEIDLVNGLQDLKGA